MAVNIDMTLNEAAGRYLATLKAEQLNATQTELNRFVRWYGSTSKLSELRAQDVESYQEQVEKTGADTGRRLEPLKLFLAFAHKQGLTETNLGRLIKARRSTGKVGRGSSVETTSDE